jgi:hypothetical protein
MRNAKNENEMAPKDVLVRYSKDHLPPWRDFPKLLRRCEDINLSLVPTIPVLLDSPLALAYSIM